MNLTTKLTRVLEDYIVSENLDPATFSRDTWLAANAASNRIMRAVTGYRKGYIKRTTTSSFLDLLDKERENLKTKILERLSFHLLDGYSPSLSYSIVGNELETSPELVRYVAMRDAKILKILEDKTNERITRDTRFKSGIPIP